MLRAHKFISKNRKLHKLALPIVILKKSIISDMHHRRTYMYINFQQNQVIVHVEQSKPRAHKFICKSRKLHKFATISSNFKKSIILGMHHSITYMYINFQQNRVATGSECC